MYTITNRKKIKNEIIQTNKIIYIEYKKQNQFTKSSQINNFIRHKITKIIEKIYKK